MFFLLLQIPLIKENELTERNDPSELRNLENDVFGAATLPFESSGLKTLVNVNDVPKQNLSFYLKSGDNLTEIDSNLTISQTVSEFYEGTSPYNIIKVSYNLSEADDEIVVKIKEKPPHLKGCLLILKQIK